MTAASWNELTAVFGGRFDPPHLGHLQAARDVLHAPGIRRLLIVPSAAPPHKAAVATAEQRAEMARIGFEPLLREGEVRFDLRELDRFRRTGLPSYSFQTLQELGQEWTRGLAFVVGADQLSQLKTWYRFPEVLGLCHWLVLERKPDGAKVAGNTLKEWVSGGLVRPLDDRQWSVLGGQSTIRVLPTTAPDVSSTAIREQLVRTGAPPAKALSEPVETYLKAHRIYGMKR